MKVPKEGSLLTDCAAYEVALNISFWNVDCPGRPSER